MTANDTGVPSPGGPAGAPSGAAAHWIGATARLVLVLAILGGGGGLAYYYLITPPQARRRPPGPTATLVEVQRVRPQTHAVIVDVMGPVRPARTVELTPQVSGQIVEISDELVPGGRYAAGEMIVRIDPNDYQFAVDRQATQVAKAAADVDQRASEVAQRATDVTRAECDLKLEEGQQDVARHGYELLDKTVGKQDLEWVLRQPQLRAFQAACDAARAAKKAAEATSRAAGATKAAADVALRKAQLELTRTTVRAPFNTLVAAKHVDLGSQVSPQTPLARLIGTDEYWVEVAVPVDELTWLTIPRQAGQTGSPGRIYYEAAWGPDAFRTGHVIRQEAELEEQSLMARLLVAVEDPLSLRDEHAGRPALIAGSVVRVKLEGRDLAGVVALDRSALHDGDRVWVMGPDDTLEIRRVSIVHREPQRVYVGEGLQDGERLVVSDLATPVEGMKLREARAPASSPGEATPPAADPETRP